MGIVVDSHLPVWLNPVTALWSFPVSTGTGQGKIDCNVIIVSLCVICLMSISPL